MELAAAYSKLLSTQGYCFVIDPNGNLYEWEPQNVKIGWWDRLFGHEPSSDLELHLIPGSFNPLHDSHKEIFLNTLHYLPPLAIDAPPALVCYEMSINRIDKPSVTLEQLFERVQQFRGNASVLVSKASRFIEKIETYRPYTGRLVFHVGIDVIIRMKDDYGLRGIEELRAQFIVYDRIIDNKLRTLQTECVEYLPKNCQESNLVRTHESLVRSSTAIRNQR